MRTIHICLALLLCAMPLFADKYAGEIFTLSPGVISSAMGGTGLTYDESFSAAWWNPALLSVNHSPGLELMRSQHFEGLLDQNQLSFVLPVSTPTAIIINHLAIDDVKLTKLEDPTAPISNNNRPYIWKTVSNNDIIVYGAIARQLKDNLHYGFAPKLAYRDLARNSGWAFGADLGVLWEPASKLRLAANLRNFFTTQVLWEDGENESVAPSLDVEAGWEIAPLFSIPMHLAVRSEMYAEERGGTIEAGDLSADIHTGIALQPLTPLKVLLGYDIDAFTAGLAISHKKLGLNYAFKADSPDGLGYTQSISASYKW